MTDPDLSDDVEVTKKTGDRSSLRRFILGIDDPRASNSLQRLLEERHMSSTPLSMDEKHIIANILQIEKKTVKDVMLPRARICALSVTSSFSHITETIARNLHSRYPVFEGSLDNTIGMVHIKDVLSTFLQKKDLCLKTLMRPAMFAVPSMRILDLLVKMRVERQHMAIIVDEFGGIDGLITIENVIEEIVGNIQDEHDQEEKMKCIRDDKGGFLVDAGYPLQDLQKEVSDCLSLQQHQEDIKTVGGLIEHLLGKVPCRGEIVHHYPSKLVFEILKSDPRRIVSVYISHMRENKQNGKKT